MHAPTPPLHELAKRNPRVVKRTRLAPAKPVSLTEKGSNVCSHPSQFTYETYSKTCMLYAGFAEIYRTDGLMSGIVSSAIVTTASDLSSLSSSINDERPADVPGGGAEAAMAWMNQPPPPEPPALRFGGHSPPPSPPPGELESTKIIVADVSMGIASLMGLGFCICAYCFFREDMIAVANKAKHAKNKMSGKPGHKGCA